jgi:hypothetical protein
MIRILDRKHGLESDQSFQMNCRIYESALK